MKHQVKSYVTRWWPNSCEKWRPLRPRVVSSTVSHPSSSSWLHCHYSTTSVTSWMVPIWPIRSLRPTMTSPFHRTTNTRLIWTRFRWTAMPVTTRGWRRRKPPERTTNIVIFQSYPWLIIISLNSNRQNGTNYTIIITCIIKSASIQFKIYEIKLNNDR